MKGGLLLVDKPAGTTSAGVVREVKRRLAAGKVGHLGTLDPFATGLLPLCVGEGAKVVPFLEESGKTYEGTIRLGVATDTLDPTGREIGRKPVPGFDDRRLEALAGEFRGEIEQVPPMFSALKRGGVPLYRLAREGIDVPREARRIRIDRLELRAVDESAVTFEVACSKGTYVRTLAADLAERLGTVGHLETLRRTGFGPFRVEEALPLDAVGRGAPLVSVRDALGELRELPADARLEASIRRGQQRALTALEPPLSEGERAKLVGDRGDLVAVVGARGGQWRLLRVFA